MNNIYKIVTKFNPPTPCTPFGGRVSNLVYHHPPTHTHTPLKVVKKNYARQNLNYFPVITKQLSTLIIRH